MAKQPINVGTSPNDNRGDSLRAAFQKINANFTELYTALGLDVAPLNLGAFEFVGSTLSTTDSSAIVIDQAVTVSSNLTVGGDITFPNNTVQTTAWPGSVSRLVNGAYELVVETDGIISSVAFPERDGGKIFLSGVEFGAIPSDPADTAPYPLVLSSQQGNVRIKSNAIGPMFEWRFDTNGRTIFPNGAVPAHSYGALGDLEGMVVFTDPYIYYCKQDYVDNTTDIWVRVAWTGTNW